MSESDKNLARQFRARGVPLWLLLAGLVGASLGFLIGNAGQPHAVVIGVGADGRVPREFSFVNWLWGSPPARVSVDSGASSSRSDDYRVEALERLKPQLRASEATLLKRSLSTEFQPVGFREKECDRPIWSQLRTASISVPVSVGPTLEQVIDNFAKQTNIDFGIDWKALREAGLEAGQTSVRLGASIVTAETALREVLDVVVSSHTGEEPSEPLAFDVRDGKVVIATKSAVMSDQVMAVYDVRDLLVRFEPLWGPPDLDSYLQRCDELKQLIYDGTEANWAETGQGSGRDRITEFELLLVVWASPFTHRQIDSLLSEVREARRRSQ
jgi:hypothetical protein